MFAASSAKRRASGEGAGDEEIPADEDDAEGAAAPAGTSSFAFCHAVIMGRVDDAVAMDTTPATPRSARKGNRFIRLRMRSLSNTQDPGKTPGADRATDTRNPRTPRGQPAIQSMFAEEDSAEEDRVDKSQVCDAPAPQHRAAVAAQQHQKVTNSLALLQSVLLFADCFQAAKPGKKK